MTTVGITGVISFYAYVLDDQPDDIPRASHVRKFITSELFIDYAKGEGKDNSWN